jgi:hypothetical protein
LGLACAPAPRGAIGAEGFRHNDYAYRVVAQKDGGFLPESWKIDNYYGETGALKPKDGKDWIIEYSLDENGDGEEDLKVEELIYDLRFEHLVHDGVIFLRTIPISTDLQQKKLSVLMERYIEGIAGAGYEVVSLNSQSHLLVEKRYAAAIVGKGPTKLAGRDAYVVLLEVANIDQLKIDPNARKERVELVLLHTDFEYKKESVNENVKPTKFPVIMFAGYANQPAEFDAGQKEFHEFLGRIEIDQKRGFEPPELGPSKAEPAPEAAPKENAPATAPEQAPAPETPPSSQPAGDAKKPD